MKPLALYIHWPFCRAKCPYCDFNSHVRERVDVEMWGRALLKEMAHMAAHTPDRRLASIFFGGGTPSLMPPAIVASLIEAAAGHWPMEKDCEITLEANPTSVEASSFAGFRAAGVNRVSLGVQALNEKDLAFLGRRHSAAEALDAVALAARMFPRFSFDLIYALPGQSVKEWKKELAQALGQAGDHLSLYQLTIEENTAFHTAHAKGAFTLPEDDAAANLYEATQAIMESAGLPAYEISNHARPGQESRHNLAYWRGQEYAGIGPGAHGRINGDRRIATATLKSPERWLSAVEEHGNGVELWQELTEEECREEALMMRLRLSESFAENDFPFVKPGALKTLEEQGLLENRQGRIRTTRRGKLLLNSVTASLLA